MYDGDDVDRLFEEHIDTLEEERVRDLCAKDGHLLHYDGLECPCGARRLRPGLRRTLTVFRNWRHYRWLERQ